MCVLSQSETLRFGSSQSIPSNSSTDNKSDFLENRQSRFQISSPLIRDYASMTFRKCSYPIALHTPHSDYHFATLPLLPLALLPRYANTVYMCLIDPSLVSILDRFGVLLLPPCCAPPVPKWWLTLVTPFNHINKLRLKETEWKENGAVFVFFSWKMRKKHR